MGGNSVAFSRATAVGRTVSVVLTAILALTGVSCTGKPSTTPGPDTSSPPSKRSPESTPEKTPKETGPVQVPESHPKVPPDSRELLREARSKGTTRVLVKLKTAAEKPDRAEIAAAQAGFLRRAKRIGLDAGHRYKYQALLAMRVDAKELLFLLTAPDVVVVTHDSVGRPGSTD